MMFQGSENIGKSEHFILVDTNGGNTNGTTNEERTLYYETLPANQLDLALFLEVDRMRSLDISKENLDNQRNAVQEERRLRLDNQAYGKMFEQFGETMYDNFAYKHSVIGSMEDLNAASLADVKSWFRDYYGAANTVIVLAGDIDVATAKEKVAKYFGDIPAGKPVPQQAKWTAPREASTRAQIEDRVAQVRITRTWNIPGRGDRDLALLDLASDVLGGGKSSRLYQRLVYQDKLVDNVSVSVQPFELVSSFNWEADVKQGVDPAKVEAAVNEELAKFIATGPTEEELARYKATSYAANVRSLERVGGKASRLAESLIYLGSADGWKRDFDWYQSATAADVQAAAKRWLSKGDFTLTVVPAAGEPKDAPIVSLPAGKRPADIPGAPTDKFTTTASAVDRSKGVPEVSSFPDLSFPAVQRGKLKNGIEVVLAERHSVPVVNVALQFDAGYASDAAGKLGTASFAASMLDEGTATLDSVQIAQTRERLGLNLSTGCGLDACTANANLLKANMAPSLALLADVVRNPAFRDADIERQRAQWLAGIAQEKTQPVGLALRVLPPLVYGAGHPYAIPFSGTGNEASIKALGAADLRAWQSAWLRPDNVRIIVAGDTTLPEITKQLDAVFGDWQAPAANKGAKSIPQVAAQAKPRVFLIDKPGAQQSLILAGLLAPSTTAPNNLNIETMNDAFGGLFSARLNMNLREDKHWAYGSYSFMSNAKGQRPYMLYAPVQTDKTAESAAELLKEAREVISSRPLTAAEIAKVKDSSVRSLPGGYETIGAVAGALADNALYGRPDDYVATLKQRMEAQRDADVQAAAKDIVKPDALTWVIVGDLSKIEAGVRALNLGEVQVVDADGKPVAKK